MAQKFVRCLEGHVFDESTHTVCPVCGSARVPTTDEVEPQAQLEFVQAGSKRPSTGLMVGGVVGAILVFLAGAWTGGLFDSDETPDAEVHTTENKTKTDDTVEKRSEGDPGSKDANGKTGPQHDDNKSDFGEKKSAKLQDDDGKRDSSTVAAATDCDRYAMSPLDLDRIAGVPGVYALRDIDSAVAVAACERAVQAAPNERRLRVNLARAYRNAKNDAAAAAAYRRASELGSAMGAYGLALMLRDGHGMQADQGEARRQFRKAADSGLALAMVEYANMVDAGRGGPANLEESRRWYERAAELGNPAAVNMLGVYHLNGKGGAKDYAKAREQFDRAVSLGDVTAISNIGYMMENGLGVEKNLALAMQHYEKAANGGNWWSMRRLGSLLLDSNPQQAQAWLVKAAERGDAQAMTQLGHAFNDGRLGLKDPIVARQWFDKAAERGDADAMNMLGVFYHNGNGVPRDHQIARNWYQRAIERGNAQAMANLGVMYEFGQSVPQNFSEAWRLFETAATRGNAFGMLHLGQMAEYGKGVNRDIKLAITWYAKAGDAGNADAKWRVATLLDRYSQNKDLAMLAKTALGAAKSGSKEAIEGMLGRPERSMSRDLRAAIESELASSGFYAGPTRGRFDRPVREALENYIRGKPSTLIGR